MSLKCSVILKTLLKVAWGVPEVALKIMSFQLSDGIQGSTIAPRRMRDMKWQNQALSRLLRNLTESGAENSTWLKKALNWIICMMVIHCLNMLGMCTRPVLATK